MEHIVRPGETLASIASNFGVTVHSIMLANELPSHHIFPGQRLFIPVHPYYHHYHPYYHHYPYHY